MMIGFLKSCRSAGIRRLRGTFSKSEAQYAVFLLHSTPDSRVVWLVQKL